VGQGRRDEPGTAARARAWHHAGLRPRGGDALRNRDREGDRARWHEGTASPALPLVRPAPRSAMFFPLVVIAAVLPGLYGLNSWDLTPPGPWWGLRALAVLDGHVLDQTPAAAAIKPGLEAWAFRTVAAQPPLYAWLAAAGFALGSHRDPLASVLPSYVAGAAVVVLVYLHGRLWRGPGVGLVAAVLTAFNRNLLLQMQQATPTTLALAGVLGALLCYGRHLRASANSAGGDPWCVGGPVFWAVLGGLALGVSLMAVGLFGLAAVPVVAMHQAYLRAGAPGAARERPGRRRWAGWLGGPGFRAAMVALGVAAAVAAPWHVWMFRRHGAEVLAALLAPLDVLAGPRPGLLARLVRLAPATLPLGLLAAVRAVREALTDETDDRSTVGGALWVLWLAAAALVPAFWPGGPRPLSGLFLLVPLNLLAAQGVSDLACRRIPVRTLNWLAPLTAVAVAWWVSDNVRNAVADLARGRADSATALGLHLAADLLVAAVWLTRVLDRWARRRDDRQRRVLAGFLLAVTVVTVAAGSREVGFRHRETDDLLMLRTMILRRDRERPFQSVAVVGPETFRLTPDGPVPGGRLRFILRSALPGLPQRDLTTADDLLGLPEGERLVVLAGSDQRLPYALQSKLKLEAIHPGRMGVLDAFATAHEAPEGRPRRRE